MMKINKPLCLLLLMSFMAAASLLNAKEVKKMTQMKMTTPAFENGQEIPEKFTCDGNDVNPHLVIEGVPREAKSLALIMDDPDAPAGTWVHWMMWNIDPAVEQIPEGSVPHGAQQGVNSWKRSDYGGPCPPSGTHRYFFRLYALSDKLSLPTGTNRKDLDHAMHGKILAQCELMGTYSSKK
jgi:Raf kinase inhibitor-like YbhB/YbcL family protein